MGDPVALTVLTALSGGERDVHGLVVETGLPQSSVYRKLRELTERGVVFVPRLAFTREGRKVEMFRSRLQEVRVVFANGRARIDVVLRQDMSDRIGDMWEEVRGSAR
ncbi:MAG: ArsR family transcriptional regulator [Thermoplasmata archaeon]|nr:ArsR family transcriptional regulator [Thermoplasmata archaeon]